MHDLFRDSSLGQCLRVLTGNRVACYPEEQPDFALPTGYIQSAHDNPSKSLASHGDAADLKKSKAPGNNDDTSEKDNEDCSDEIPNLEIGSVNTVNTRQPSNTIDHKIIVTWYSSSDPENPHNWSTTKKTWTSFAILIYTFGMYIGSSLYTASTEDIMHIFGVSRIAASVGLSIYVLGYSIGPLLWSPLSEIPAIGRNAPYVFTFFLFVILCIPTAYVNNFAGLLVLRFWLGFFGSPALATGGASYGDFCTGVQMPYVLALWGGFATLGPALGPVVAGFAVQNNGWRWSSYELLWLTAPSFLVMFFSLPETSSDLILLRRARRLRKLTGRTDLQAESEMRQANMKAGQIAFQALIKPWEINIKDPAMLFSTIYTALIYGIYYSFFESFPLVFSASRPDGYGFDLGETGLAFIAVLIGMVTAVAIYCAYFYFIGDPKVARMEAELSGAVPPEVRLRPGLVATFLIPVGLFVFAWTSHPPIPWAIPLLGVGISMLGVFIIMQCMFIYLPFTYPKYAGSLFAANGFARGAFAAGAILFAAPMFKNLGVNGGVSLLGGLTVGCCAGMYALYFYGARLRGRSKFAE